MSTLSEREHAHYAKELIKACGGPSEVERILELSAGMLSKYSNVGYDVTMPAKAINVLEDYCGRQIYSGALFGAVEPQATADDITEVACDLTESAANVQAAVRKAMSDKRLTQNEVRAIAQLEAKVREDLATLDAILRAHDGASLRVVSQ